MLGKKSFRPIGYFKAEINTYDWKFETGTFVLNDNSINFDLINGSDAIQ